MMIRWKNKNPYLNFYRETKRVLTSNETSQSKISLIELMMKKDYSGTWLFSHPSHKHLGNKVPLLDDDVTQNPLYLLHKEVRSVLRERDSNDSKLKKIHKEFSWYSNESDLSDWVYTS